MKIWSNCNVERKTPVFVKHLYVKLNFVTQGQDCLDQEEEIRIAEDGSDGSVQRAGEKVVCKELICFLIIAAQVSRARQGEELLPPHVSHAGVRRVHQPEGAMRGAAARHPELVERQGRLCPASH